jgi:hypothetical protein
MAKVYVDEIRDYGPKGQWSHMWTDGEISHLHWFAEMIGLRRTWFQDRRKADGTPDFQHYDVTPAKRAEALKSGATFMPLVEWIRTRRLPIDSFNDNGVDENTQ